MPKMSRNAISFRGQPRKIDKKAPIQSLFGDTPAAYIVIPRLVLQSMPVEWQTEFVDSLLVLEKSFKFPGSDGRYQVNFFSDKNLWETDPLWDHRQGGRKLKRTISGGIPDGVKRCGVCGGAHPENTCTKFVCVDCKKPFDLAEAHRANGGKVCLRCFSKRLKIVER